MVGGMGLVRREIIIHLRSLSLLLGQNPNLPTKIQKNLKNLRNTHPRGGTQGKKLGLELVEGYRIIPSCVPFAKATGISALGV